MDENEGQIKADSWEFFEVARIFLTVRSKSEVRPNPFYIIVRNFLDLRGLVLRSHHRFAHPANSHRSVGENLTIGHSGP